MKAGLPLLCFGVLMASCHTVAVQPFARKQNDSDRDSSTQQVEDSPFAKGLQTQRFLALPKPVVPVLECVEHHRDGTYSAWFGYDNKHNKPLTIPPGILNGFLEITQPVSPGNDVPNFSSRKEQPQVFMPGRTSPYPQADFKVPFRKGLLIWHLNGYITTASVEKSRKCAQLSPIPTPIATATSVSISTPSLMASSKPVPTHTPGPSPTPIPTSTPILVTNSTSGTNSTSVSTPKPMPEPTPSGLSLRDVVLTSTGESIQGPSAPGVIRALYDRDHIIQLTLKGYFGGASPVLEPDMRFTYEPGLLHQSLIGNAPSTRVMLDDNILLEPIAVATDAITVKINSKWLADLHLEGMHRLTLVHGDQKLSAEIRVGSPVESIALQPAIYANVVETDSQGLPQWIRLTGANFPLSRNFYQLQLDGENVVAYQTEITQDGACELWIAIPNVPVFLSRSRHQLLVSTPFGTLIQEF